MNIVTASIDFAKNVFAFHSVDQSGEVVFGKAKVLAGNYLKWAPNCRLV